jgi:hypothetical protein
MFKINTYFHLFYIKIIKYKIIILIKSNEVVCVCVCYSCKTPADSKIMYTPTKFILPPVRRTSSYIMSFGLPTYNFYVMYSAHTVHIYPGLINKTLIKHS